MKSLREWMKDSFDRCVEMDEEVLNLKARHVRETTNAIAKNFISTTNCQCNNGETFLECYYNGFQAELLLRYNAVLITGYCLHKLNHWTLLATKKVVDKCQ